MLERELALVRRAETMRGARGAQSWRRAAAGLRPG